MVYVFAVSSVTLLLYLIYLNIPMWLFFLSLTPLPLIYLSRKRSMLRISNSISANQIFLCALIPIMLLRWNDMDRTTIYTISFVISSYTKSIFIIFRNRFILFLSWLPICYVIFDLLDLRFENKFYGILGVIFVLFIAFRDLSIGEGRKKVEGGESL